MIIKEAYNKSKNNFLFNTSKNFLSLREKILNEFDLSPKNKKNNESLKYLDPHVLEFSYKYNKKDKEIYYIDHNKNNIEINVIDGNISTVHKKAEKNVDIQFNNIKNENNIAEDQFLDFQNNFNQDYVLNLNSLMLNSGYEIKVAEDQEINIFINSNVSEKGLTIFQKNIIKCAKNSKIFIFEEILSNETSNNNLVNFFDLEEGSNVTHLIFQNNKEKANLQFTSCANCKNNSKYKQVIFNISKGSVRNHHYANLLGNEASVELDGIFFAANKQIIDNKTEVNHRHPNCHSSQRYKGILTDQAKASYLSKTFVDKIAQKTEAYQLSKGILLSKDSYFHSKPELKIFADDVKCSHGSTIGPIDRELLFYLRSRGLDKKQSTSQLIKSFFYDIISETDDKIFLEKFNYHSNIWLRENNI